MPSKVEEVLAAQSTLLAKLGVFTVEEVQEALANGGYHALYDLLNEKYKKLLDEGRITHDPRT